MAPREIVWHREKFTKIYKKRVTFHVNHPELPLGMGVPGGDPTACVGLPFMVHHPELPLFMGVPGGPTALVSLPFMVHHPELP